MVMSRRAGVRRSPRCVPSRSRNLLVLIWPPNNSMSYLPPRPVSSTTGRSRPCSSVLQKSSIVPFEIDRSLYLDEETLQPSKGYDKVKADLTAIFTRLAQAEWRRLV